MEIRVDSGDITESQADAIIVNLFAGVATPGGATGAVDRALDGAISRLIELGDIKGKRGENTLIHSFGKLPSPRVIVSGLGKADEFSLEAVRAASANAARFARGSGARNVASVVHGAGIGGLDPQDAARATVEGAILGAYRFLRHKKPDEDAKELEVLTLVEHNPATIGSIRRGAETGDIVGQAVSLNRDMGNEPGNHLTPTAMADRASQLAAVAGYEVEVYDRAWMEEKGMGALLGVAAGSSQPPRFIVMRHRGSGGQPLALVGKGITFDSGGISIKPANKMEDMKGDMSGGAAVIAALWAIGRLKLPLNVIGVVPASENLPSGSATKPGDVLKAMNGKTIEVINTDAEGRLVLADALCYAAAEGVSEMVDIATLTGAATYALGPYAAGIMGNDDALCRRLQAAADTAGERLWPMPMFDDYDELIKSDIADVKNTGGRGGGMITAARFLSKFTGKTTWAHIDIASVDVATKDRGVQTKGATGYGVRTLIQYALDRAGDDRVSSK
jgi:leucyl aminopeptidase